VERQDLRRLGVFPIHDVVAMRRELVERERWLATNVYRALEIARRRYVYRLTDIRASRLPIPSVAGYALSLREFFGPDLWSYGLAANRSTLQAFLDRTTAASDDSPVDSLFYPVEPFVDGM
jgi:4,5-dihydroxyphthalate decarboxylase